MIYYVLYNPLSGNGEGGQRAQKVRNYLSGGEFRFIDVRDLKDHRSFLKEISSEDHIIIAGGDGTLNRFINFTDGIEISNPLFYFAVGNGNDFKHDVAPELEGLIPLEKYIKDLPTVTVNGKSYRFLNGIGYGIDGYCCEVGDEMHRTSEKPVNYTTIAIKGLLFYYKPTSAKVTVDGKTHSFQKVWLAPTMNGRFYGGGMMVAPEQDRMNAEGKVSVVLLHGSGKLKTLTVFPSIFKGEHIKHTEMVSVFTGDEITVEFDRPTALQIDGETVLGVTKYTVNTARALAKQAEKLAATV